MVPARPGFALTLLPVLFLLLFRGETPAQGFLFHSSGRAVEVVGDVDRDGVLDYVLGVTFNQWHVISGRDGTRLYAVPGIPRCRGLRSDFDGDGAVDIVTAAGVFSGKTGRKLALPGAQAAAGDLDGDRTPDLIRIYSKPNQPVADYMLERISGKTGRRISETKLGGAYTQGWTLRGAMPDVSGDGVPEHVIFHGAPNWAALEVRNGVSGVRLYRILDGHDADVFLGDVTGDRVPDLLVFGNLGARVHSGADGQFVRALPTNGPVGGATTIVDHDQDGYRDVVVTTYTGVANTTIFSARTGRVLQSLPTQNAGAGPVRGLADVDGDGKGDFLVANRGVALWTTRTPALRSGEALADVTRLSRTSWTLDAGAANAQRAYFVLGSMTGTRPGFRVLGRAVPLNVDAYSWLTLQVPNGLFLGKGLGVLDGGGTARIDVVVPPGLPFLRGLTLHHAAVVGSASVLRFVSNPVPLVFY